MFSCRIWQSFRKCESHKSCVDENVRKVCCSSRKALLTSFALSSIIGLSTFQINLTWIDKPKEDCVQRGNSLRDIMMSPQKAWWSPLKLGGGKANQASNQTDELLIMVEQINWDQDYKSKKSAEKKASNETSTRIPQSVNCLYQIHKTYWLSNVCTQMYSIQQKLATCIYHQLNNGL